MRQWRYVVVIALFAFAAVAAGPAYAQRTHQVRLYGTQADPETQEAIPSRPLFMAPISAPQVGELLEDMDVPTEWRGIQRLTFFFPAGAEVQSTGYPNVWCAHRRGQGMMEQRSYDACFLAENGVFTHSVPGMLMLEPAGFTRIGRAPFALRGPVRFVVREPRPTGEITIMYRVRRVGPGGAREIQLYFAMLATLSGAWVWEREPFVTAPITADGSARVVSGGLDIDFTGIDARGRGSFKVNSGLAPTLITVHMASPWE